MEVWLVAGVVAVAVVAIGIVVYQRRALGADPRLSAAMEGETIVLAVRNHGYRPVHLEGVLVSLDEGGTPRWIPGSYGPQELGGRRQAIFTTTPAGFVEHLPGVEPRRICVRTADGDTWWPVPPPVQAAIAQANARRLEPEPA